MDNKINQALLRLDPKDNVVVAVRALEENEPVASQQEELVVRSKVPAYFKLASTEIPKGTRIIKHGLPIGTATQPIAAGELVHSHNMKSNYAMYQPK